MWPKFAQVASVLDLTKRGFSPIITDYLIRSASQRIRFALDIHSEIVIGSYLGPLIQWRQIETALQQLFETAKLTHERDLDL